MYKIKLFLSTLIATCAFSNGAMAQLLEVKSELDERAISIKVRDGVPSSRVIVSSSLSLSYSSNMGDITDEEVGYGSVNGLGSDTLYFYLAEDDPKRIITISAEGYPPIDVPFTFSPKETYRCLVFDPKKKSDDEANPATNTSGWQYLMAQNFDFGRDGFNEDQVEALSWYEKAADQGHGLSQVTLGVKYASGGNGFAKDAVKSARWFLIAAQQNYDTAQYAIANCFLQGNGVKQDSTKAYNWFQQAADKGIDEARYRMAGMILSGFGSDTQIDELLAWFEFFANENRPEAQYMYSKLLLERRSSTENNLVAVDNLNKAIALSNIDAMLLLGERCLGKTIDQYNVVKGMELLRMAEGLGSSEARRLIDQYDNSLSDNERFIYTEHFAQNGSGEDMVKLANMYYNGIGTELNYSSAVECFIEAISSDMTDAFTGLAQCYYYGRGVSFDYYEAFECFKMGAKNNNPVALSGLGMCYFLGLGVEADVDKAYELFVKSNNGTNGLALNGLGLCFFYGRPIAQDRERALALFEEAVKLEQYDSALSLGYFYQTELEVNAQKVKNSYTLSASAGNPEAQNRLGLFIIDCGYKIEKRVPTKENPETSVMLPPTELELEEAAKWFEMGSKRESIKSEYNHAYSLVITKSPEELRGSESGKKAVEIFRSAAQKGSIEAMVALSAYYDYDLGLGIRETYNWLKEAIEKETDSQKLIEYKAYLGAFMSDQAPTVAGLDKTTVLETRQKCQVIMEEAFANGCHFLYPRILRFYKEVINDKKTAREWTKTAKEIGELNPEPLRVVLQR